MPIPVDALKIGQSLWYGNRCEETEWPDEPEIRELDGKRWMEMGAETIARTLVEFEVTHIAVTQVQGDWTERCDKPSSFAILQVKKVHLNTSQASEYSEGMVVYYYPDLDGSDTADSYFLTERTARAAANRPLDKPDDQPSDLEGV